MLTQYINIFKHTIIKYLILINHFYLLLTFCFLVHLLMNYHHKFIDHFAFLYFTKFLHLLAKTAFN
jgi:hypothetical protein